MLNRFSTRAKTSFASSLCKSRSSRLATPRSLFSQTFLNDNPTFEFLKRNLITLQAKTTSGLLVETGFDFGKLCEEKIKQFGSLSEAQAQPILVWGPNADLEISQLQTHKESSLKHKAGDISFVETFINGLYVDLRESGKIDQSRPETSNWEARISQIFETISENEFFEVLDRSEYPSKTKFESINKKIKEARIDELRMSVKSLVYQVKNGVITPREFAEHCRGRQVFRDPGENINGLMLGLGGQLQIKATTEDVLALHSASGDLYCMGTTFNSSVGVLTVEHIWINSYNPVNLKHNIAKHGLG